MKGFADIARLLHQLKDKGAPFCWTESCQTAFEDLKRVLTSTPILGYPTINNAFVLDCDASGTGLGSVLSQIQEGQPRVTAYYSRCLSKAERRYCVTRCELLAVVQSVKHFYHYLYGRKVTV